MRRGSHSDTPLTGPRDLIECRELTPPPRDSATQQLMIMERTKTKTTTREKIIIFNTLMRMHLKCTRRCPISLTTTIICLTMRNLQRCLPLRMGRTIPSLKMTSKATSQAATRTLTKSNSSRYHSRTVPPLVPSRFSSSSLTTIWVTLCSSKAAVTTPSI